MTNRLLSLCNPGRPYFSIWMLALLLNSAHCWAVIDAKVMRIDKGDRTDVSLTVYQQGLALVTDTRSMVLPDGPLTIEFLDVAISVLPDSVRVKELREPGQFILKEQHFRYDPLNRKSLLNYFIGKKVKYSRSVLEGSSFEKVLREGTLLSASPEIVQFGDQIEIEPEGIISLAYIPEDLRVSPALVWEVVNNRLGEKEIETRYLTEQIEWSLDYTLELDAQSGRFDLDTWVTVNNRSGSSFESSEILLVAGEINRSKSVPFGRAEEMVGSGSFRMSMAKGVADPEAISGYHMYRMPDRHTIDKNEARQIKFLSRKNLSVNREFRLTNQVNNGEGVQPQVQNFDMELVFENNKSGPNVPLPAGKVRVYQEDNSGSAQFVGEDQIAHIAVGEEVRLIVGKSFDLVAERTQTSYRRASNRSVELGYTVNVRNQQNKSAVVLLNEQFFGTWKILSESQKGKDLSSMVREYQLEVPGGGAKTLEYSVRLSW